MPTPKVQDAEALTLALSCSYPELRAAAKAVLVRALTECGGNVVATAAALGIDRRSLFRMLARSEVARAAREDAKRPPSKATQELHTDRDSAVIATQVVQPSETAAEKPIRRRKS